MPLDLQQDLATLEAEYARVEAQLATQQADQQEQLQALADQFTAENTTLAREMVMLSGALRHVRGQIARDEQAESDPSNGDLSLLQRITHKQEAERLNAVGSTAQLLNSWGAHAAIPDNDPD